MNVQGMYVMYVGTNDNRTRVHMYVLCLRKEGKETGKCRRVGTLSRSCCKERKECLIDCKSIRKPVNGTVSYCGAFPPCFHTPPNGIVA